MSKIEVAKNDLLRLRRLLEEKHNQIEKYLVVSDPKAGFEQTRESCIADLDVLRKFHRRLTLAVREVHGHDCHPQTLERITT